jgi:hypothetical protein
MNLLGLLLLLLLLVLWLDTLSELSSIVQTHVNFFHSCEDLRELRMAVQVCKQLSVAKLRRELGKFFKV